MHRLCQLKIQIAANCFLPIAALNQSGISAGSDLVLKRNCEPMLIGVLPFTKRL